MENFIDTVYTANQKHLNRFTDVILRYFDEVHSFRILDIGCGTGEQLFALSENFKTASFIGVDVSDPNIKMAKGKAENISSRQQFSFIKSDYLKLGIEPCQLIVSDSTLHLIADPTPRLFTKISEDLTPGGILIFTMPYICFYNSILVTIRRLCRLLRGRITDKVIFLIGKLMHANRLSETELRQRVQYMYLLPYRYLSAPFIEELKNEHCLELIDDTSITHESLAQPKHRMVVFRKSKPQ